MDAGEIEKKEREEGGIEQGQAGKHPQLKMSSDDDDDWGGVESSYGESDFDEVLYAHLFILQIFRSHIIVSERYSNHLSVLLLFTSQ